LHNSREVCEFASKWPVKQAWRAISARHASSCLILATGLLPIRS
jgi:hypothetical protein